MPAHGRSGATATTVPWKRIKIKVWQGNSGSGRSGDILAGMADLSDFYGLDVLLNDDEQMIRDTVKKCCAEYKKTHMSDNWEVHRSAFTQEQLEALEDVVSSPHYYA